MLHPPPHTLTSYSTAGQHWSAIDIFSLRGLTRDTTGSWSAAWPISLVMTSATGSEWAAPPTQDELYPVSGLATSLHRKRVNGWPMRMWAEAHDAGSVARVISFLGSVDHSTHDDSTHRKHISHAAFGLFWLLPRLLLTSDWWMMLWAGSLHSHISVSSLSVSEMHTRLCSIH